MEVEINSSLFNSNDIAANSDNDNDNDNDGDYNRNINNNSSNNKNYSNACLFACILQMPST